MFVLVAQVHYLELWRMICFVFMCVCVFAYVHVGAHRSEKKVLGPLELELQVALSYVLWVLRTELGSSARASHLKAEPSLLPLIRNL